MGDSLLRTLTARARFLALLLAVACLASLVATVPATAVGTPLTVARTQADPGPGDDFPLLPGTCDDPRSSFPVTPCRVIERERSAPTVVIWGDSHSLMYLPAFRKLAKREGANLVVLFGGSCPPVISTPNRDGGYGTYCETHNARSLAYVRRLAARDRPVQLIVGAFWSAYRLAYRSTRGDYDESTSDYSAYIKRMSELSHDGTRPLFEELGRLRVSVDVIGQAAIVPPDVRRCPAGQEPYQCTMSRSTALRAEAANRRWLRSMLPPLAGRPRYIDATSAYCTDRVCRPRVDGANTFYDDVHLGKELTGTMTRFFAPSFRGLR